MFTGIQTVLSTYYYTGVVVALSYQSEQANKIFQLILAAHRLTVITGKLWVTREIQDGFVRFTFTVDHIKRLEGHQSIWYTPFLLLQC